MTTEAQPAEAVLLTGGLGSGKTTVAIQIGEILEYAAQPFAVVDLDWLCWAWSPSLAEDGVHGLMCQNLRALMPNLLSRGCRRVVLARAILSTQGLAQLRDAIAPVPLHVVRLTTTREHAVRRLHSRESVGSDGGGRLAALLARIADFEEMVATASADAPVIDTSGRDPRSVAADIVMDLGWTPAAQ